MQALHGFLHAISLMVTVCLLWFCLTFNISESGIAEQCQPCSASQRGEDHSIHQWDPWTTIMGYNGTVTQLGSHFPLVVSIKEEAPCDAALGMLPVHWYLQQAIQAEPFGNRQNALTEMRSCAFLGSFCSLQAISAYLPYQQRWFL